MSLRLSARIFSDFYSQHIDRDTPGGSSITRDDYNSHVGQFLGLKPWQHNTVDAALGAAAAASYGNDLLRGAIGVAFVAKGLGRLVVPAFMTFLAPCHGTPFAWRNFAGGTSDLTTGLALLTTFGGVEAAFAISAKGAIDLAATAGLERITRPTEASIPELIEEVVDPRSERSQRVALDDLRSLGITAAPALIHAVAAHPKHRELFSLVVNATYGLDEAKHEALRPHVAAAITALEANGDTDSLMAASNLSARYGARAA